MVVIRQQQMEVLRRPASDAFEDEMMAHSKEFSPRLSGLIGDEQLRLALRGTIQRAMAYGFTNKGPIRLCVEMMFLFGSRFDNDAQYPWAGAALRSKLDQMHRAEQLHQKVNDYQDKVSGAGNANTRRALENLSFLAKRHDALPEGSSPAELKQLIARIFPEKAAYVGDEALTALIARAREEAETYRFATSRGIVLLTSLMFAFGHGCAEDPLYPWISRTLQDEKVLDHARADRLEKKAVTWLDHVLARAATQP